jgi:predicted ATPase/DNA-binding winged helix-turn-helix (wHTH) protein
MTSHYREIFSFGQFRLSPEAREIERDGVPLALGDRALDILILLVERAGEIVSHRELISHAWRGLVVSPGNLRVHMTGLRKTLGDGEGSTRYIANVAGQGYCFVAPVAREGSLRQTSPSTPASFCAASQGRTLPPLLARMVGREDDVRIICADLVAERFVTIVGPGGMGKTTVAVSVAHAMFDAFAGGVYFIDIGATPSPKLVTATVASTLGLAVHADDAVPTLMAFLRTTRMLLILDNCEHAIDVAAQLAESIYSEAPGVHILATSREALRVEGEHAYWLQPLESAPPESSMAAADIQIFPAVKLFVERATASGRRFELSDTDAPVVAGICGRLDGIALAIEIAAGHVGTHGIEGTARLLEKGLGLHWQGRRTALPRHQTLHALLDWSYSFLTEAERLVLRRLSIFVGAFSLEAAQVAAGEDGPDETHVADVVDRLVAKSLVSAVVANGRSRFRLLETTRAFALEKLEESGEKQAIALRHARYFASILGRIEPRDAPRSLGEHLSNLRAALAWSFGGGDPNLAIELTVGSIPIFLELSLLGECHDWSAAALLRLDDTMRGSRKEMVLQEALAVSSTWTRGNGDDVRAAIMRALEIADERHDTSTRLRLLAGLHMFLLRAADIRGSLAVAEELENAARIATDATYSVIADWLLGCSRHFMGDQSVALQHLQKGFARSGQLNAQLFGLDYRLRGLIVFHRVLWLSGFPIRALEVAREAIREAEASHKPVNACFALLYTLPTFLWCDELRAAQEALKKLMTHPSWHSLPSLHATAFALQGELAIRQGDGSRGLGLLRSALPKMRADRQTIQLARASCAFAEGLAAAGQLNEALTVISDAIIETEAGTEACQLPELLRVHAEILLSMPSTDEGQAEATFMRSLASARRQSALAWELRATLSLARLRAKQRRQEEAHQLLSSVYGQFTEGFETNDLKSARRLLAELAQAARPHAHSRRPKVSADRQIPSKSPPS